MLGIQIWGRKMVGADETTEQCRPHCQLSHVLLFYQQPTTQKFHLIHFYSTQRYSQAPRLQLMGPGPLVQWLWEELVFRSLWVESRDYDWMFITFFTYFCCKNCNVCMKKTNINEKEAEDDPFLRLQLMLMTEIRFFYSQKKNIFQRLKFHVFHQHFCTRARTLNQAKS